MNTSDTQRPASGLSACGLATVLLGASLAVAKGYDIATDTVGMQSAPLQQAVTDFPSSDDTDKRLECRAELVMSRSMSRKAVAVSRR